MLRRCKSQFSVRVTVRSYEIDSNGHVNHAVYHQYGEHARSEQLLAAGYTLPVQQAKPHRCGDARVSDPLRAGADLR